MWTAVAVAAALAPALFAWLSGRRLAPLADDAALPERLAAHRKQLVPVAVVAGVLAGFAAPDRAPWLIASTVLALVVAGFPLRRALFRESWGLAAYLTHVGRATLAGAGFWLLLAATPLLVLAAHPYHRPAAVVLVALLLAWELSYSRVFLWLVAARPLDRPDLALRFDGVLARARTRPPRLRLALWQSDAAWLVEPGRRLAWQLDLPQPPVEVVYRSGRLGTVSRDHEGITVRLYALD